ncbi:MAG: hypothetical protein ABIT37_03845 [Luteolibacter sp.]
MNTQPQDPDDSLNIGKIIDMHRARIQAEETAQEKLRQGTDACYLGQKTALRRLMAERTLPIMKRAAADLEAEKIPAHVTHSEEERGGDTIGSWIVSTIMLEIPKDGKRLLADLTFIGTVTQHNWHITAHIRIGPALSALEPREDLNPAKFVGTPEELESFTRAKIETFIKLAFPS